MRSCSRSATRGSIVATETHSRGAVTRSSADAAGADARASRVSFGSCSFREPVDDLRALASLSPDARRDARPDASLLGRVGERPGDRFPDSESSVRRVRRRGAAESRARRRRDRRPRFVDLAACASEGLLDVDASHRRRSVARRTSNALMSLGRPARTRCGARSSRSCARTRQTRARATSVAPRILVAPTTAEMLLPADIGDYTDFYASIHHATNVGSMFRPDNPLLPNYKWVPIGYHGRASSIVVSGTAVRRPRGQTRDDADGPPAFGPIEAARLRARGRRVHRRAATRSARRSRIDDAERHVFGLCLVNDWSARDIQAWEYQPLGPFLAKNFATTVSPWVVTLDALAPFRAPAFARAPPAIPQPLPYLSSDENDARAAASRSRSRCCSRTRRCASAGIDAVSRESRQLHRHVLDARAARRAPREQRLQPPAGRSARERHGVGADDGIARVPARAHVARHRAARSCRRARRARFSRTATRLSMRGYCERAGARASASANAAGAS